MDDVKRGILCLLFGGTLPEARATAKRNKLYISNNSNNNKHKRRRVNGDGEGEEEEEGDVNNSFINDIHNIYNTNNDDGMTEEGQNYDPLDDDIIRSPDDEGEEVVNEEVQAGPGKRMRQVCICIGMSIITAFMLHMAISTSVCYIAVFSFAYLRDHIFLRMIIYIIHVYYHYIVHYTLMLFIHYIHLFIYYTPYIYGISYTLPPLHHIYHSAATSTSSSAATRARPRARCCPMCTRSRPEE